MIIIFGNEIVYCAVICVSIEELIDIIGASRPFPVSSPIIVMDSKIMGHDYWTQTKV